MPARRSSRIINVSSFSHASPSLDLDNLMSEKSYSPWGAYSQVHSLSAQQSRSQLPESMATQHMCPSSGQTRTGPLHVRAGKATAARVQADLQCLQSRPSQNQHPEVGCLPNAGALGPL